MPRISVLMPVRNGAAWIETAARSVLAQTVHDLELIVVDDGSTDLSAPIVAGLANSDGRLVLARQPARGLVVALQAGLALARAPLLARLDADDIAMPERLAKQAARMDARPDLALLGTWARKIDADGRDIGRLHPPTSNDALQTMLLTRNPFVHSSIIAPTALVRRVGGYREVARGAEDYDLWLRLAEHGEIEILPEELISYRVHAGSVTRQQAVRQSFAARISRRAARVRRAKAAESNEGADPLATLQGAPDWWNIAGADECLHEDAHLCRLLDLADRSMLSPERLAQVELPTRAALDVLNHVEKRLLREALVNLLRASNRPPKLSTRAVASLIASSFLTRRH